MNRNRINTLVVFLGLGAVSLVLSGCDSFRSTFGLDHYQPDEFNVSGNPPLSMPKDYKLRPPAAGGDGSAVAATSSTVPSSQTQAHELLLGGVAPNSSSQTQAEQNLLVLASGQQQAAPDIRETVNREAAVATNVSDSLIQRIMSWKEEAARNIKSIDGETKPLTTADQGH